jgi:hypothetical protein
MTWVLRGLPGSEWLIEYETRLDELLHGSTCLVICQYDQRRFHPEVLSGVLGTHPVSVVGTVTVGGRPRLHIYELKELTAQEGEATHYESDAYKPLYDQVFALPK